MSTNQFLRSFLVSFSLVYVLGASGESLSLVSGARLEAGATIESLVVTEHGNPFVLVKNNDGSYTVRQWNINTAAISIPAGGKASNLVALNNGTLAKSGGRVDALVLFSFLPNDGHQLHLFEFSGVDNGGFSILTAHFKYAVAPGCNHVNHLGLSAGLRDKVFFSSDCLIGEFDFAQEEGRRIRWTEKSFNTVYAALPPAVDYHGRGHFLVKPGSERVMQVVRSLIPGGYEMLASFNDIIPPAVNASLLTYPFTGLSIMADGTVFLSGRTLRRLKKNTTWNIGTGNNKLWGRYGVISASDAMYVAEVDTGNRSSLSIRRIPYDGQEAVTQHAQTELNTVSRLAPGSLGLVDDGNGRRIVYYANGQLFKQNPDDFDAAPEQLNVSEPSSIGSASPADPVLAGADAYIKGRTVEGNLTYDQTYRMVLTSNNGAPFANNIRGFWSQPGADQQRSFGVPAGVEVLLNQSVRRAALSCHLINDEDNAFLLPEGGVLLRDGSKLLSIYHHELTSRHLMQLQAGVECRPYQLEPGDVEGSGNSNQVPGLVKSVPLGDRFQLQLVAWQSLAGGESVPLWATDQVQINGALSSEVSVTAEGCANNQSSCTGYRRLAIGGDPESDSMRNNNAIILAGVLGGLTVAGFIIVVIGCFIFVRD